MRQHWRKGWVDSRAELFGDSRVGWCATIVEMVPIMTIRTTTKGPSIWRRTSLWGRLAIFNPMSVHACVLVQGSGSVLEL